MVSEINLSSQLDSSGGHSRRAMFRIHEIHRVVLRGKYPNCRSLAEAMGVTQKTVNRDITFMRESLELPIAYDGQKHGYHFTKPVGEFPLVRATVEDLVAVFLAQAALAPLEGTPIELTLRESFRRIAASLSGEVTFRWSDLDEAFSVRPGSAGAVRRRDIRVFEQLSRAVLECRCVAFDYRKLNAEAWEARSLQPYHLAEVDGGWYVIGYDRQRGAKRTFALQRIKGLRLQKSKFARPTDFDLGEHLGGSFGVWSPAADGAGERALVRLRFSGWAANFVAERRWHPSQQSREVSVSGEKALELSLELDRFEEIRRWILSWGAQVEVLEPKSLREEVAEELGAAVARY